MKSLRSSVAVRPAGYVTSLYAKCYFKNKDKPVQSIEVTRLSGGVCRFHPERLAEHKEEIKILLSALPEVSRQSNGSGLLLSHCLKSNEGLPWTDDLAEVIQLLELGVALELLIFLLPHGQNRVSSWNFDRVMILLLDQDC